MKAVLLSLILITSSALLYSQPITNGLTNYWSFNGSADDLLGNLNGVTNGTPLTLDRHGFADRAYSFFEIGDHIRTPELNRSERAIAISIWCKPSHISTNYLWIVNQRDNTSGDQFQLVFNTDDTHITFFDSNRNGFRLDMAVLELNEWSNIVVQSDGKTGDILEGWINNVYQGSITLTNDLHYNVPEEITIGNQGWNLNGGQFKGVIDEVMIFNRTLSSSEVQTIYEYDENYVPSELWQYKATNIFYAGKVAINGEDIPSDYELSVHGKIISEEIKVALVQNWPDYVFEGDYEFRTLEEVEEHINEKGHLPEIPSETEVTENGINLGEMNAKLLQKIEELTLYLIEHNNELKSQQIQNQAQQELIEQLQKEVSTLKNE